MLKALKIMFANAVYFSEKVYSCMDTILIFVLNPYIMYLCGRYVSDWKVLFLPLVVVVLAKLITYTKRTRMEEIPIYPRRFTWKNEQGRVCFDRSDEMEICAYLYELEEYLVRNGYIKNK